MIEKKKKKAIVSIRKTSVTLNELMTFKEKHYYTTTTLLHYYTEFPVYFY